MNTLYAIKNLAIKNFKCYDDSNQCVSFGKELTIIIGQNGAGKTVFLNALKKVISIILTKDRRRNVNFIGDVTNIKQSTLKDSDARYNFDFSESGRNYEFPVVVNCEGVIRDEEVNWYIEKVSKGSRSVMTYREALDLFLSPLNDSNEYPKLPILCYFSDCYPHVRNDLSLYEKDILYSKSDNPERRAGYYRWDDDNVDFLFWSGMFVNAFKKINDMVTGLQATEESLKKQNLPEGHRMVLLNRRESLERKLKEIKYITHILIQFTRSIKNYDNQNIEIESIGVGHHIVENGKEVDAIKINFANGTSRYFDMLPEGHKRLFSIVFEIAYRNFVLNRNLILNDEFCHPEGIVIIDEVELHLHPSLAEEALARLRSTFPNIQFIVTTHSPLVVSNIYNDDTAVRVLRLDKNHRFVPVQNCFKAEYGDTLVMAMGAYSSMRYTTILRERYIEAVLNDDEETIDSIRNDLMSFVGNIINSESIVDSILAEWRELI